MADFNGTQYTDPALADGPADAIPGSSNEPETGGGTSSVTWFKMRAVDSNAGTVPPTYRTWTVQGTPDWDASQYAGPYSGGSPNLTSVRVASPFTA